MKLTEYDLALIGVLLALYGVFQKHIHKMISIIIDLVRTMYYKIRLTLLHRHRLLDIFSKMLDSNMTDRKAIDNLRTVVIGDTAPVGNMISLSGEFLQVTCYKYQLIYDNPLKGPQIIFTSIPYFPHKRQDAEDRGRMDVVRLKRLFARSVWQEKGYFGWW